jgi:hypothetical protein
LGCPTLEPEPDWSGQAFLAADDNADNGNGNSAYFTFPGSRWVSVTGSDGFSATSGYAVDPHWAQFAEPFDLVPGEGARLFFQSDNEITGVFINGAQVDTCSQSTPCGLNTFYGVDLPIELLKPTGNIVWLTVRNYEYGVASGGADYTIYTVDPPTIATFAAPADGATYALGQQVTASYACKSGATGGQSPLCSGPVESGQPIDTAHAGPHTFTVTAKSTDGDDLTATATHTYTVSKGTQTITFGPLAAAKLGVPPITLGATSSAGLPVSYAVRSGPCTVSGSTLTIAGAGSCSITASQAGSTDYDAAAPVTQVLMIARGDQSIAFTSTPPANASFGGSAYTVSATASSGLSVSLSVDPSASSVCAVSGATVTFIGVGNCTVDADQPGDANWNAAARVQQSFAVAKAVTVLAAAPARKTLGNALGLAPVSFSATLTRSDSTAAIAGQSISFAVGRDTVCTAVTGSDGKATCSAQIAVLFVDRYTATFAATPFYYGSSSTAAVTF